MDWDSLCYSIAIIYDLVDKTTLFYYSFNGNILVIAGILFQLIFPDPFFQIVIELA